MHGKPAAEPPDKGAPDYTDIAAVEDAAVEDEEAADSSDADDSTPRTKRGDDGHTDGDPADDDAKSDSTTARSAARKEDAGADRGGKVDAREDLGTADAAQTSYSTDVTPVMAVTESPHTPELAMDETLTSATSIKRAAADVPALATPVAPTTPATVAAPVAATALVAKVAKVAKATVAPSSAAPATTPTFLALLETAWRNWVRMWSNATPTMPSRRVEVELTGAAGVSEPISFGGVDADGDSLAYTVSARGTETGPKYGSVTIDQATGTFVYNPDDALTGATITDTFTVTARDNGLHFHGLFGFLNFLSGHGTTATMTVVVGAVNEAPKAVDDKFSGIKNSPVKGDVLTNDTDREGQPLTATVVTNPKFGALDFHRDGSFTYTPNANFTGTDGFTYTASDGTDTSLLADVTISMAVVPTGNTPTIGVQGLYWWLGLSDADTDRALDMAKSGGVTSMRIDISWYVVEYFKGTRDWSLIDPLVDKVVARDISVLGLLFDTPEWLSGSHLPNGAPSDPQLFAQFASAAATHYLGRIDTWEIWNEPNIPGFWATPDPVAYAALLKAVYPAIKAVDSSATVITGGLSPNPSGIDPLAFVKAMYAAGAGGYFDALSMHPYYFASVPNMDSVKALHDVMSEYGDGAKKVWLTEFGAPTGTSPAAVSEETQAQIVAAFIDAAQTTDYIGPVYLYSLLDTGFDLSNPVDNYGLIRRDFTPKPAFGSWLRPSVPAADGSTAEQPVD